jgi:hypothetical protein
VFDRTEWLGRFADRPRPTKIAVLGFTSHWKLAPFDAPEWMIFGLNDLYHELTGIFHKKTEAVYDRYRHFQLHGWAELKDWGKAEGGEALNPNQGPPHPRDPYHVNWLREASKYFPVYVREPRPELPDAIAFPRHLIYEYFNDGLGAPIEYFTNSISWMIAAAIMELVPEPGGRCVDGAHIGVWGVDMMQGGGEGSEYGWQRPSCEWLLGWARGAGVKVSVPAESDLLKSAYQYGDDESFYFRKRITAYRKDVSAQLAEAERAMNANRDHGLRMQGANGALEWVERSHMPGDDGSRVGRAPILNAHKGLPLLGAEDDEVGEPSEE